MSQLQSGTNMLGTTRHYFVDEAGDATLFAQRGRVLVGTEGCSRYFMLGYVDIADAERVAQDLVDLRQALLADPYFRGVPSMQRVNNKTSVAFHAKDDLPEVRREVMSLLLRQDLRFFAVIRDKMRVVQYALQRGASDPTYRYRPNELYDLLVRRLFKDALHKADAYEIHFARRGQVDRSAALHAELDKARRRFQAQWGISSEASILIESADPPTCAGLQAADYMLWALQRYYERRESRYIEYLWPKCRLVIDIDDVAGKPYGVYYTQKKPLVSAAL